MKLFVTARHLRSNPSCVRLERNYISYHSLQIHTHQHQQCWSDKEQPLRQQNQRYEKSVSQHAVTLIKYSREGKQVTRNIEHDAERIWHFPVISHFITSLGCVQAVHPRESRICPEWRCLLKFTKCISLREWDRDAGGVSIRGIDSSGLLALFSVTTETQIESALFWHWFSWLRKTPTDRFFS